MEFDSLAGMLRRVPDAYCYHRARLMPEERTIYDRICEAICRKQTNVTLVGIRREAYEHIFEAVKWDQPLMYYVDYRCITRVYTDRWTRLTWKQHIPPAQVPAYDAGILAELKALSVPGDAPALAAEVLIHDWLLSRGIRTGAGGSGTWADHCIVGPLLEGHTVCEGMSMLFHLLCLACGVPCMVIGGHGRKEAHAWNMVCIDGCWTHVDTYWDSCLHREESGFCYDYLNLGDAQARADHSWKAADYPACPQEPYSYFSMSGAAVSSLRAFEAYAQACFAQGKRAFCVRLLYDYDAEACVQAVMRVCRRREPYRVRYSQNRDQRVLSVCIV